METTEFTTSSFYLDRKLGSTFCCDIFGDPDCYSKVVTKTIIQNIQIPQTFEYSGDPKNGNLKTGIIQKCFVLQNLTTYKPPLFWPSENPLGSVFRSRSSELFEVWYLNGLRLYCFCHLNTAGPILEHHSNF